MTEPKAIINEIILLIVFILYNYEMFKFADGVLEHPRLHARYRIPMGLLNLLIVAAFLLLPWTTSFMLNIMMLIVLTLEFFLLYRDRLVRAFALAAFYVLHLMVIRIIVTSIFSAISGYSIYEMLNTNFTLLISSTMLTFFLFYLALVIITRVVPPTRLKMINKHSEQFRFLLLWLVIADVALIANSRLFSVPESYSPLNIMQMVTALTILAATYVVIFFSLETSILLGYKEKNSKLETEIEQEQQYRSSLIGNTLLTYEFDIDENCFENGFESFNEVSSQMLLDYRQTTIIMAKKLIHPNEIDLFLKYAEPDFLKNRFESGENEVVFEYRRLFPDDIYRWVRGITILVKERKTGHLKGFSYVKDINDEKMRQLELTFKAERDPLTGLYNKGMTHSIISDYIREKTESADSCKGALLLIDIDDFKTVNDRLGHIAGDALLTESAEKLTSIFRASDVVGRIGGDEFMIFMSDIKDTSVVEEKAMAVCAKIYKTFETGNQPFSISASIGIALYPESGSSLAALYNNADIALYDSKNKGKNTYTVYGGQSFCEYASNRNNIQLTSSVSE